MAQGSAWTAREYRRRRALEGCSRRPPDRVDAAVDAMETPKPDSVGDLVPGESQSEQLSACDVSVLSVGDRRDRMV